MQYWLLKTEPHTYSIDDLKKQRVGVWDGVRNYQARNHLRAMEKGDQILIYHSSTDVIGIAGLGMVVKCAYADPTQFDQKSNYYDSKATPKTPIWSAVSIRFIEKFPQVLTLQELKNDPFFSDMLVTQRGMRLSVQPVSKKHYNRICTLIKKVEKKYG